MVIFRKKKNNDDNSKEFNIQERRLITIFSIVSIIIIGLVARLSYIQIINGESLKAKAFSQWFQVIDTVEERGTIYDRNLIPLANKYNDKYLVIGSNFDMNDNDLKKISELTELKKEEIVNLYNNKEVKKFLIENYDNKLVKELLIDKGITIVNIKQRYDKDGIASHVIGYINKSKNIGEAGLEKAFDSNLVEGRMKKIGAIVDAKKRILPGFGYMVYESEEDSKKNIVTTIDYNIQKICEEILDKKGYKGSIVVLDSKSGDILSMVSRPNFNQDNISDYLDSDNHEFYNKAIQMSFPPGSIFKIVVAAAAIENNLINEDTKFFCDGFEELGNIVIKCSSFNRGGHGELNFKEAFAVSCNSTFIQLGNALGGEKILEMAKRFGLGEKTGIYLDEEIKGSFPSKDDVSGPGVGNISIGQGTLEVTPLQAARLTNTVVNNGVDVGVNLVKEINNDRGEILERIEHKKITRIIDSEVANTIKAMMKEVVDNGTGKRAKVDGLECGGKTGSAEAVGSNGETVHAWFTGFFLGRESEYVVAVIVEDKDSGGREAAPIFAEIAKRIIELDM